MAFFDGPSIGKRVARYRRMNGWTMEELASRTRSDIVEISKGVIANIETGRKVDIGVGQLISLASALQVPPVALMMDLERMSDRTGVVVGSTRALDDGLFGWITGHWPIPEKQDDPPSKRDVDRKIDALHDYLAAHRRALDAPQSVDDLRAEVNKLSAEVAAIDAGGSGSEEVIQRRRELLNSQAVAASKVESVRSIWREEELALKRLDDLGVRVPRSLLLDEENDGAPADPAQ